MKVEIKEAELWHIIECIYNMRDLERSQCEKMWGLDVEKEAARIFAQSFLTYVGLIDGKSVVVWGVYSPQVLAEEGYVWLLGSRLIEEHPIVFLRHSRRALDLIRPTFKTLYGVVLSEFDCGQKWLEWLGFDVGPDEGGIRAFSLR
jgi:hypothetical protein